MTNITASTTPIVVEHELDLGEHSLILMSDGSADLIDNEPDSATYVADNAIILSSDELYKLYVSLHAVYQSKCSG